MSENTNVYADILKYDDNGDGTLTVYGKATDDALDIDQQICDPVWLDRAMPDWFRTGGNIREQHSNIAAGVAKEYEAKADGHYISALVVDPVSVKKVQNRVLRGFSIGIKSPRVVRDQKAANGRIIDGQIVEVSLVDRPANPNCQLILAKSVAGESTLIKSEELIEKHGDHDQSDHNPHGGGGGKEPGENARSGVRTSDGDKDRVASVKDIRDVASELRAEVRNVGSSAKDVKNADKVERHIKDAENYISEASRAADGPEHVAALTSALGSLDQAYGIVGGIDARYAADLEDSIGNLSLEIDEYLTEYDPDYESMIGMSASIKQSERSLMKKNKKNNSIVKEMPTESTPMGGEAKAIPSREEMAQRYASARKALDDVTAMCKEYGYGDIDKQYGETAEEETAEGPAGSGAEHELGEAKKEMVDQNDNVEMSAEATTKCLECGCNMPGATHGLTQVPVTGGTPANEMANVSTATMITPDETPLPKSVETIVPPSTIEEVGTIIEEEDSDEDNSADKSLLADVKLNDIIEKAVKSAMSSVEAEVALLKSAKEAVENKATELQTELATAKSLAIGGGPKRTTIATGANKTNEWKAKADLYFAKASATTDLILAKGYRDMAKDFLAKSAPEVESK